MARQHDAGVQLSGALERRVEIIDLEPEEYAVAIGLVVRIPDWQVVMGNLEPMQLQDEHTVENQPLVFGSAMYAATAQQVLIPPAACFDIGYANERLGTHRQEAVCG